MSSSDGILLTPQLTMVFFTRSPWPRVASSVWAQDRIDGHKHLFRWFRISVKKEVLGDGGRGGGWAMEGDMSCINTKVVTSSLHIKYRLTSRAGHTTKLPRQQHHVFRSQCCWCIYYYSPWSAPWFLWLQITNCHHLFRQQQQQQTIAYDNCIYFVFSLFKQWHIYKQVKS